MTEDEAWVLFGLEPGAPEGEVKRRYRELAKRHHPDLNPGDPDATARFQKINAAFEILSGKRKPDTPHQWRPPEPMAWVILIVISIAGGGKTRQWARGAAAVRTGRTIIAAPTIILIKEIRDALHEFGVQREYIVIHSEDGAGVKARIQKLARDKKTAMDVIFVITHAAALDLPSLFLPPEMAEWDLTFDEIPDAANFIRIYAPWSHWRLSNWVSATRVSQTMLRLGSADWDTENPRSAYNRLRQLVVNSPVDMPWSHFSQIAAALIDPLKDVFVLETVWRALVMGIRDETDGEVDFMVITRPETFQPFKSITLMGARADRSLSYKLWSRMYGVRFTPHPLQAHLASRHTNGSRLTVFYAFEERISREFLKLRCDDGHTMFNALALNVVAFYRERLGDPPFLWSAPQQRTEGGVKVGVADGFFAKLLPDRKQRGHGFDPNLRLPGRTHGLNVYRHIDHVVLLSVVNFSPQQVVLLEGVGFSEEELLDIFAFHLLYQDLCRGSMRNPHKDADRTCFVPDLPSAMSLAQDFPGCRTERLPDQYVPKLRKPSKRGPKPAPGFEGMSDDERRRAQNTVRQRERRARMRAEREGARERERET